MKNTLADLNNHLFAQLERLGDEDLKGDELREELERAKAVAGVAEQVISNGTLVLKARTTLRNSDDPTFGLPKMLEG